MSRLSGPTASQTAGPFFSLGLLDAGGTRQVLAHPETPGERIRVEGRVFDGDGLPLPDALVEIWQADAAGRYQHPAHVGVDPLDQSFAGFGRCGTDEQGLYWFETVKPGPVPLTLESQQMQAPHICLTICARGLLNHLFTRLYFADEPANAVDAVLNCVPVERRATLLAGRSIAGERVIYRLDIVLQGKHETAFFQL